MMFYKQAENIYHMLCVVYQRKHTLQKAVLSDFPELPLAFYVWAEAELKTLGFLHSIDYQDVTLNTFAQDNRTVVRVMIDRDAQIYANISSVFNVEKNIQENIIDLTSFMTDGTVCSTVNSLSISKLTNAPIIKKRFLEPATPIEVLVNAHETLCFEESYKNRSSVVQLSGNSADVFIHANQIYEIEAAYRESIPGKLLYDELLSAFEYDDQIAHTMQKILIEMDKGTPA